MSEQAISFQECQPIAEDGRLILEWRNNPSTLKMFYHSKPKEWDSFWQEYVNEYFLDPALPPLFATLNSERVGFFKFSAVDMPIDKVGRAIDVSINIDPDKRGQGLGTRSLCALSEYFKTKGSVDCIVSEIKKANAASIKSFAKAGYVFLDEFEKYVADIEQTFSVYRYLKKIE